MAGKGDTPRPVDRKLWEENFTRIFPPKPIKSGKYIATPDGLVPKK